VAVAAAAAGIGSLGLRLPSAAPEAPRPPLVTVVPPGPGSPAGQIASGTVGRAHWSARVTPPGKGQMCLIGSGDTGRACGLDATPLGPADLEGGLTAHGYRLLGGPVQPRVTRVEILLADGQRLVLHPAAAWGQRWIAVALPVRTLILRAVAYHGRAVYRYAIPFTEPGPNSFQVIQQWLRPGSAGPPRQVFQIASGTADGHRWAAAEYTGPWGKCLVVSGGSDCRSGIGPMGERGKLVHAIFDDPGGVHLGAAAAGVAHVELDLSSGQQVRLVTRAGAGGERFYAFVLPRGTRIVSWTAYGPARNRLGSGTGASLGFSPGR
jgi:hypothetical protein